jgi:AcrR family transcriptional regulator
MSVRSPVQGRSVASLERMLSAAEEVLRTKSFDQAGVAEIAARAGVTVGAFYARFSDKDALLQHLEERVYDEVAALAQAQAAAVSDPAVPLGRVVHGLLAASLAFYRKHGGTLRALDLRARTDPALRERMGAANRRSLASFAPAVLGRAAEIRHPHPAEAVRFAVLLVGNTLREATLFGTPWLEQARWDDDKLLRELTRAFLAYLGVSSGPATATEVEG